MGIVVFWKQLMQLEQTVTDFNLNTHPINISYINTPNAHQSTALL